MFQSEHDVSKQFHSWGRLIEPHYSLQFEEKRYVEGHLRKSLRSSAGNVEPNLSSFLSFFAGE